jgi:poly-gamma-glutamate synthesis protein (capsule biosynthesis protein)
VLAIDDVGSKGVPGAELALASDRPRLKEAITKVRAQANFAVCLVHWGIENTSTVTERQRELGRWLIREGVNAVVGSHPHCVQSLDFYHGCPIAYSLGNLVFDGAPRVASWNRGALLEIGLIQNGIVGSVRNLSIVLQDGLPQIDHGMLRSETEHESGSGLATANQGQ